VHDVAGYSAKYLSKDIERGDVLLSPGLGQGPVYQRRMRVRGLRDGNGAQAQRSDAPGARR
jgi:hypothetical protein